MILNIENILDELEEEYPDITRDSLKKICEKGLSDLLQLLRAGDEVVLRGHKREIIKFYYSMLPETQHKKLRKRYYIRKKKERDAKTNDDKQV